jgi:hypothetical protein
MTTFGVTEVESFLRCRRNWNITSFNRWALSHSGPGNLALDLGGLIHKSLADWTVRRIILPPTQEARDEFGDDAVPQIVDMPEGWRLPQAHLSELFDIHTAIKLQRLRERYRARVGVKPKDSELASIFEAHELGQAMMINYEEYHGSPLPKHMKFVSPEQEVMVPVPGTAHKCKPCDGTGYILNTSINVREQCSECHGGGEIYHYLKGTLDALVMDTKDRLFIIEHKTYGSRPNEGALRKNWQFTAYIWLLTKLEMGSVGGLCYDGMWKRKVPPKGKTMEDMFIRHIEHRNQSQLDKFEYHLSATLNNMDRIPQVPLLGDHPELYITVPWKGCFDCTVSDLCTAMERGENPKYTYENFYEPREKDDPIGVGATED